jgi:hypothetical protein
MDRAIGWWMSTRMPSPVKNPGPREKYKTMDEYMDNVVFKKIHEGKRTNGWYAN